MNTPSPESTGTATKTCYKCGEEAKTCSKCGEVKVISEYNIHSWQCKACKKDYDKSRNQSQEIKALRKALWKARDQSEEAKARDKARDKARSKSQERVTYIETWRNSTKGKACMKANRMKWLQSMKGKAYAKDKDKAKKIEKAKEKRWFRLRAMTNQLAQTLSNFGKQQQNADTSI